MAGNVFDGLNGSKQALRKHFEGVRRSLGTAQVDRVGGEVLRRLTALPFFTPDQLAGRTVALYAAQSFEVPTRPIADFLTQHHARLAFPRVEAGTRVLSFFESTWEALVPRGRLALLEPPEGAVPVALETLSVMLVPGVAFTPAGDRLGRGGGFYDSTLVHVRAPTVAVTFDECLTEHLPMDAHDRRVGVIVTQSRTFGV